MSTNVQIAVTSRKYMHLLRELINDATIGHLRNHLIFSKHVIGAVSGLFAKGMAFA